MPSPVQGTCVKERCTQDDPYPHAHILAEGQTALTRGPMGLESGSEDWKQHIIRLKTMTGMKNGMILEEHLLIQIPTEAILQRPQIPPELPDQEPQPTQ